MINKKGASRLGKRECPDGRQKVYPFRYFSVSPWLSTISVSRRKTFNCVFLAYIITLKRNKTAFCQRLTSPCAFLPKIAVIVEILRSKILASKFSRLYYNIETKQSQLCKRHKRCFYAILSLIFRFCDIIFIGYYDHYETKKT